jgi:hypothetical protein
MIMQSCGGSHLRPHVCPLLDLPLGDLPALAHLVQVFHGGALMGTSTCHRIIAVGSIEALKWLVESAMCAHSLG